MRNALRVIAIVAYLLTSAVQAEAATTCRFVLGFGTLASLIPQIVGQCVEDEGHNPANGDALQQTTTGLLVWRKADNWTAFTDGYRTWIAGPYGLFARLNSQRFPWEADASQYPPAAASSADFSSFVGTWLRHGLVVEINADGSGAASWRVYSFCSDGPPPCDSIVDNEIMDGGHASLRLQSVTGASASGTLANSSDPQNFPNGPITITLRPYDMATLTDTGRSPAVTSPLCGDAFATLAPPSVQDTSPCGA